METSDLYPETVTPESVRVERARLEALKAIAEETNRPELLQFDLKFRDQGEEVFLQKLSMDPDAAPLQAWFFKLNIALKNRSTHVVVNNVKWKITTGHFKHHDHPQELGEETEGFSSKDVREMKEGVFDPDQYKVSITLYEEIVRKIAQFLSGHEVCFGLPGKKTRFESFFDGAMAEAVDLALKEGRAFEVNETIGEARVVKLAFGFINGEEELPETVRPESVDPQSDNASKEPEALVGAKSDLSLSDAITLLAKTHLRSPEEHVYSEYISEVD